MKLWRTSSRQGPKGRGGLFVLKAGLTLQKLLICILHQQSVLVTDCRQWCLAGHNQLNTIYLLVYWTATPTRGPRSRRYHSLITLALTTGVESVLNVKSSGRGFNRGVLCLQWWNVFIAVTGLPLYISVPLMAFVSVTYTTLVCRLLNSYYYI